MDVAAITFDLPITDVDVPLGRGKVPHAVPFFTAEESLLPLVGRRNFHQILDIFHLCVMNVTEDGVDKIARIHTLDYKRKNGEHLD